MTRLLLLLVPLVLADPAIAHRVGSPRRKAGFFIDEVDSASAARSDWRRDPDGDDGAAGVVRPEAPDIAMPATGIAKRWKSST